MVKVFQSMFNEKYTKTKAPFLIRNNWFSPDTQAAPANHSNSFCINAT